MYRFIKSRRYINLFLSIREDKNILKLSKESGLTAGRLSIIIDQWVKEGLFVKVKNGREISLVITEFGKHYKKALKECHELALKQLKSEKEVKNDSKN